MGEPTYPIKYQSAPGVTLAKALVPMQNMSHGEPPGAPIEYARAPAATGSPPIGDRPPATQRSTR